MSHSVRTDPYEIRAERRSRRQIPIRVTAARPGYFHPAGMSDITELLDTLGPKAKYGVRSIELRQSVHLKHRHWFGQTRAPGLILLFEQPLRFKPPHGTFREFMLEVLLHEIGHHVLQHSTGKKIGSVCRTKDHEYFAELYMRRERVAIRGLPAMSPFQPGSA